MASSAGLPPYRFPHRRLRLSLQSSSKTPLVLVACGSFSPVTYLHLRMFEMAADYVKHKTDEFECLGGYMSPVSDFYKKAGLASSVHRVRMCELAVAQPSQWLMVDSYEALQPQYVPTARVLDHFDHEINDVLGGAIRPDGSRVRVKIALLAGADLIQSMSVPGVWSKEDLDHILKRYGTFIVERSGTDLDDALASLDEYKENIHKIEQLVQNDVSSTKIRLFLKRDMSVQYLIPAPVIEYIEAHGLYEEDSAPSVHSKEKEKA
ncbi:hypothetical protein BJ878DRAFT_532809 [Calycina marina]|uniref:Nicotinamide-nucleotide adenylyltransferase n=1 Tax=Calycina marina TaxID=1763456 RepID=A0A9P8CHA1_9HELO|nr:hypothetical protein BJ878DRAFT_532809 [Calycina marina]